MTRSGGWQSTSPSGRSCCGGDPTGTGTATAYVSDVAGVRPKAPRTQRALWLTRGPGGQSQPRRGPTLSQPRIAVNFAKLPGRLRGPA